MKTAIRKTACAALAGAVFFSVTGCSMADSLPGKIGGDDKEEEDFDKIVTKTAEDYCDAVKELDVDKLVELSADNLEDKKEEMEAALDFDGGLYSEDMGAILAAIADTITYEIDEGSVKTDEDEGSIDVTFTVFDIEAEENEFGDDIETIDEALDIIEDGKTCEISLTLELENTDDGWKVEGTEDITSEVYEFLVMGTLFLDYTVGGTASYDISEDDVISAAYDLSDALLGNDVDVYLAFSPEEYTDEQIETARSTCDFSNRDLYSEDLEAILNAYKDKICYVVDEESVVIDVATGTAYIDVTYYTCNIWDDGSSDGVDLSTLDCFLEFIENTPCVEHTLTIEFQMTDSGWIVNNLDEVKDVVWEYMWLNLLGPDFDYETAYAQQNGDAPTGDEEPDEEPVQNADGIPALYYSDRPANIAGEYGEIEYSTEYTVRVEYDDHYLHFMNGYTTNMSEWDGDTHEGYVYGPSTDYWNVAVACYTDAPDLVDLTGYTFVVDHDGEVTTIDVTTLDSNSNLELNFYREDARPDSWAGDYTITLLDPWGRTLWEGYVEVA